jgi:uncharacterized secreted repeat protein (TIGR03808 family)
MDAVMAFDRRCFLSLAAAAVPVAAAPLSAAMAAAPPPSALGVDATHFGLRPGSPDDQTRILQRAIGEMARTRAPLAVPPGVYRVGSIKLATGTHLVGIRGASRLVLTQGSSLVSGLAADHATLSGLTLEGGGLPLPDRRGLVHLEKCKQLNVTECEIRRSGGSGLVCNAISGEVTRTTVAAAADAAIHVTDSDGLIIARNHIADAGNNGILVWRSVRGDDGTLVIDNRIENIGNRSGGSGQYGNGINVFRAGNVSVRGNRIKGCAYSAVRGNAASGLHIEGNVITGAREVALYVEFDFEGAIVSNNSVDGAAIGISITNFNAGGRLAVVQGNIIRNLLPERPAGTDPGDSAGIGIAVEADTAVTGNVVENAPMAGIMIGWGRYLRDVVATGNLVRRADIGIAVSVAPGAGAALIANNVLAETGRAIAGMTEWKAVTGDLTKSGADLYAHLTLSGNRVR